MVSRLRAARRQGARLLLACCRGSRGAFWPAVCSEVRREAAVYGDIVAESGRAMTLAGSARRG